MIKKWYQDTSIWADNETAQEFRELLDTPRIRMHSGRRMSIFINKPRIRTLLHNNKHSQR